MDAVNTAINYTAFPVTLVLTCYVVYRFRLDASALGIMGSYLVAMGARIFLRKPDYSWIDIIIPISATLTWGIMYYFVHQMSLIRIRLESDNKKDMDAK
jgi:drug/metabolite transporter (DMT)-like permease